MICGPKSLICGTPKAVTFISALSVSVSETESLNNGANHGK